MPIETFLVNIGGQNRALLRVLTDEHLHGMGEAYCVGPDEATVQTIRYFKEWLLGQDPRPPGCTRLVGQAGWRIRIGTYRVVYDIDDSAQTVNIISVGHRRDIYR